MTCQYLLEPGNVPRQRNAPRIEVLDPSPRCILKLPEHWSEGAKRAGGLRWICSGGDIFVFGICTPKSCPELKQREEQDENDDQRGSR